MRPNILVLDDSKTVRQLVKKFLAGYDCQVDESNNGFNGIFAMERRLPDLLLIDVVMPIMDGVQLLTMLKSKDELKTIPVIMLTATTDKVDLPIIAQLGVQGIIQKPFTEAKLVETVLSVLPLKKA
ncbi:MAG: response regulator [Verrucomicrobiota bacterium]